MNFQTTTILSRHPVGKYTKVILAMIRAYLALDRRKKEFCDAVYFFFFSRRCLPLQKHRETTVLLKKKRKILGKKKIKMLLKAPEAQ
jgi:hypothetical protein